SSNWFQKIPIVLHDLFSWKLIVEWDFNYIKLCVTNL
ncbi:unnamed protein product, partial [Arabidopsis halleri]